MAIGDVHTRMRGHAWENYVMGEPNVTSVFTGRGQADRHLNGGGRSPGHRRGLMISFSYA